MMTILITGINGNIATFVASSLIKFGYQVIGCDINETSSNDSLVKYYKCDLSDENAIHEMFHSLRYLNLMPTALINNAAIDFVPKVGAKSTGVEIEEFSKIFNVNVKAPLILSNLFAEYWKENEIRGRIINFSSIYSLKSPDPNIYPPGFIKNVLYGASKSALNNISKQLSIIYGNHNILINTIIFGGLESKMQSKDFQSNYLKKTSVNRMMTKEDLLSPILFLLDSKNNYVNGAEILVEGGFNNF